MQVVIYIEISKVPSFSYEKPIFSFIKANFPAITVYDFDNHSEAQIVKYAIDLLTKAEQLLIIIQAEESQSNHLISFFEQLIRYPGKCRVLFDGNHKLVERMLDVINAEGHKVTKGLSVTEKQQEIQSFFAKY